ncbi:DedA family protein [Lactococcus nasutitermitis]|uniref:DedA family protein n=1 Tax=Lactococcus nasutitermitis TaxID=1652957 RepID=A0ABV9JAG8_9LACT|nr:DedA family protein [Lactococcus nasutitermitis]
MQELIIQTMNHFGYIGVAFLIMIENVFPPIPSEVILTFGGFMTLHADLAVWGVILSATIGSVLGAIILYFIGRLLNVERLEQLISGKLGKILRLKKGDIRKAESWFMKHGSLTIFFCRFIPLIRSLISLPAGSAKMRFHTFLLLTTLGTLIWNIVLVLLGRALGDNWQTIANVIDNYSTLTVIVLALVTCIALGIFIKKRFFAQKKQSLN